jgi:hypothetical protein
MKTDLKAFSKECPRLIETRAKILAAVMEKPEGGDGTIVARAVAHKGETTFAVICNQLERGGWLRLEKVGKKTLIHPVAVPPELNQVFLSRQVSPPVHGPNAP